MSFSQSFGKTGRPLSRGGSVTHDAQTNDMRRRQPSPPYHYYRAGPPMPLAPSSVVSVPRPAVKRVAVRSAVVVPQLPPPPPVVVLEDEPMVAAAVGRKRPAYDPTPFLRLRADDAIEFREWVLNTPRVFMRPPPPPREAATRQHRVRLVRDQYTREDDADAPYLVEQEALSKRMVLSVMDSEE
jgi:hypothetical protein